MESDLHTTTLSLAQEPDCTLGDFLLSPSRGIISDGAAVHRVPPQAMYALLLLLRAEGRTVTRDELADACWAGRVVSEDAISRLIAKLRSLARQFDPPPFTLETIPKVGFRLEVTAPRADATDAPTSRLDKPLAHEIDATRPDPLSQHRRARLGVAGLAGLLLLVVAIATWWGFRPPPAPAHSMLVRLSGYRALSPDLPPTLRESINAELAAAFNVDGVVGVTTGPASAPGSAYVLDGTAYRVGDAIRVINRFTNPRSGVVLWSDSEDYPATAVSRIPHKIAVDAGTVIRCGLSGASTYKGGLPDSALSNYMQYCQEYWSYGGSRTLHFAQRVVAEKPDFSWGWSAVANGYMQTADEEGDSPHASALRAAGRRAEDRALALDRTNSEALAHKAYLIDPHDWITQEALFRSAIAARPLDCGCEHYGYGIKLMSVGRLRAATEQFRAATDMLSLWPDSQISLARALVATGDVEAARPHFASAIDHSKDLSLASSIAVSDGVETGDYASAITALRNDQFPGPADRRKALLAGYEALASASPQAKAKAIQALTSLDKDEQNDTVAIVLGALGANQVALDIAAQKPWLFWRRSMRGVLNEPAFPTVAKELGLMTYWRTSGTKPDVCQASGAPAFCAMI